VRSREDASCAASEGESIELRVVRKQTVVVHRGSMVRKLGRPCGITDERPWEYEAEQWGLLGVDGVETQKIGTGLH
jgi:hypothetical protein